MEGGQLIEVVTGCRILNRMLELGTLSRMMPEPERPGTDLLARSRLRGALPPLADDFSRCACPEGRAAPCHVASWTLAEFSGAARARPLEAKEEP